MVTCRDKACRGRQEGELYDIHLGRGRDCRCCNAALDYQDKKLKTTELVVIK